MNTRLKAPAASERIATSQESKANFIHRLLHHSPNS